MHPEAKWSVAKIFQCLLLGAVLLSVTACGGYRSIAARNELATALASEGDLKHRQVDTGEFLLTTYQRGLDQGSRQVTVYIEGDGNAWDSRRRLSRDPTPKNPLALKLASRDTADSVLYIARPCMYLDAVQLASCEPKYWSSHRYAEGVVLATSRAIDLALGDHMNVQITLVGFSGGGAIAALLAAQRDDVRLLITLAGNLDHAQWTSQHKISPLSGSLNPADFAARIRHIPQRHYLGEDDRIIPRSIVESFVTQLGEGNESTLRMMNHFDHSCCWLDAWPRLKEPEH